MAKATTNVTRRTVLAGAAAAIPAAAVPALAIGAEPDPIFAAIEHYRATHATYKAAEDAYNTACDSLGVAKPSVVLRKRGPIVAHDFAEIDDYFDRQYPSYPVIVHRDNSKVEQRRERAAEALRLDFDRYFAATRSPEADRLAAETNATLKPLGKAQERVFATLPTTAAGLAAVLALLADCQEDDDNLIVGDRWGDYLPRLADAAARLAA